MAGNQQFNVPFGRHKIYNCKYCVGWATINAHEFHIHILTHLDKFPKERLVCKYACGFDSTDIDALRSHELSSHKRKRFLEGDQLYLCNYCGLYALGKDKLASHTREFHNKNEQGSTSNTDASPSTNFM